MLIKGQCREAPPLACFLRGDFQFDVFFGQKNKRTKFL